MMITAPNIVEAFDTVGRRLDPERAARIARCIRAADGLDAAIAAAGNDDAHEALADLAAYRAVRAEIAEPGALAARLRREADGFDRLEERARAQAADYFGRAIFREQRGDPLGGELRLQAEAAEACADDYQAKAAAKRQRAVITRSASGLRDALLSVGA